ncbi:MAG: rod shape-determining protein [Eubacterium sp.]|nr:rod shape-determining protein [Eubacterium sp.]
MYRVDIGMDLGTSKVSIYMRDKGIVINQPSVVAYEVKSKKIIAVGSKAKKMIGKTDESIVVERPIQKGVISQYSLAERMIRAFVKNALRKRRIFGRPNICVTIPMNISEVERNAVLDAVEKLGARGRQLLVTPVAAAIGSGVDVMEASGHMVVDIGGGTTEIAIISAGDVAIGESLKFGGDDFTEELSRYVRRKYNVLLGDLSAEDAKIEVGSVLPRKNDITYEVKGRNLMNGLPTRVELSANETVEAFSELANRIADKVLQIIDKADPELVSDVTEEGILLSGGGSLIYGMEKLLAERTGLRISPSNEPLNVIAAGAGMAGEYISYIEEEKRQNDLDD